MERILLSISHINASRQNNPSVKLAYSEEGKAQVTEQQTTVLLVCGGRSSVLVHMLDLIVVVDWVLPYHTHFMPFDLWYPSEVRDAMCVPVTQRRRG
jgi:hypothetical protein